MRTVAIVLLLCASTLAHGAGGESIVLVSAHEPYVVPEGRVWKIEHLDPYASESGIGTSDLSIDGSVQIGANREVNLHGTFDFTLGATQQSPLWILAGSRVGVGDSRGTIVIQSFDDR
ncbi:hypothetical protein [Lysobacter sp. F6437]|uniref:hypothetical protein n=1 Tax=Lysobacter sp. F6437 TaxID=3459296 RepID=UPI00403DF8AB